jgi:DNA gyrase subunit B
VSGEDVREGLTAVVSVKMQDPQFEGQTKTKLGNSEVKGVVESIVGEGLRDFFVENPPVARKVIEKMLAAARAREGRAQGARVGAAQDHPRRRIAAREARRLCVGRSGRVRDLHRRGRFGGRHREAGTRPPLPGDPADPRARSSTSRRRRINKILENEEIRNIITALGAGVEGRVRRHQAALPQDHRLDRRRRRRLAHRTLLLTFLYRKLQPLVDGGYVYIAQPPLYMVKAGQEEVYCFDDKERDEAMARLGKKNVQVQRYKGLGEMNPEQLWKTTMNRETRTLLKITTEHSAEADRMFTI